jgi:ACS family hexuronate transporter-like MFS transporter
MIRPTRALAGRHAPVSLLLFLATLLNYANRFTITQTSPLIIRDFQLSNEDYGHVEAGFGYAFAVGALVFGVVADWVSVRWLYPSIVVLWSLSGICTGLTIGFRSLWISRVALGFFEAGHWSCAWRTTQRLFPSAERTRANSILQSGASIGAVVTPLIVVLMIREEPSGWRPVFWAVGLAGLPWAALWLIRVKNLDLAVPNFRGNPSEDIDAGEIGPALVSYGSVFRQRRFWLLLLVVLSINLYWHYVRVWMPLTLYDDHAFALEFINYFTSAYYLTTFVGCLGVGWLTTKLAAAGWSVHGARMASFALCAGLSLSAIVAAFAHNRSLLLAALLLCAAGSLGLFPIYYSLMQEISVRHQGKVGGTLAFATWLSLGVIHPRIGAAVDRAPDLRPSIFAGIGALPIFALFVLLVGWPADRSDGRETRRTCDGERYN